MVSGSRRLAWEQSPSKSRRLISSKRSNFYVIATPAQRRLRQLRQQLRSAGELMTAKQALQNIAARVLAQRDLELRTTQPGYLADELNDQCPKFVVSGLPDYRRITEKLTK